MMRTVIVHLCMLEYNFFQCQFRSVQSLRFYVNVSPIIVFLHCYSQQWCDKIDPLNSPIGKQIWIKEGGEDREEVAVFYNITMFPNNFIYHRIILPFYNVIIL